MRVYRAREVIVASFLLVRPRLYRATPHRTVARAGEAREARQAPPRLSGSRRSCVAVPMVDLTAQLRRTESRAIHGRVRYTWTMKFDLVGTLKPVSLMGLMRLLTTSTFWRINIDIETGGGNAAI